MSEALFILTVIFVAYVVYRTVNEQKEPSTPKAKPEAPKVVAKQPMPEEPATIKKNTSTAAIRDSVKKGLREPKTGEVATSYSNYRFTKRWIKDALVTEGLLDKVYKNNELDAAIETTIKDALAKLEAMDKYKV